MSLLTEPQSQRTNPNASDPLGFPKSGQTIAGYGCTITCIAMLSGLTPGEVNKRLQAVSGFSESSVLWGKINEAVPWLKFPDMGRHYSYDNELVKEAISRNGGCLVEVDFDGTPRTDDRHWVLYVGNQRMYDPWTGTERPTAAYPIVKGFAILDVIGEPTNMVEVEAKKFEELVTKSSKYDEFVKNGYDSIESVLETITRILNDEAGMKSGYENQIKKLTEQHALEINAAEKTIKSVTDKLGLILGTLSDATGVDVTSEKDVLGALEAFYIKKQKENPPQVEEKPEGLTGDSTLKQFIKWIKNLILGA